MTMYDDEKPDDVQDARAFEEVLFAMEAGKPVERARVIHSVDPNVLDGVEGYVDLPSEDRQGVYVAAVFQEDGKIRFRLRGRVAIRALDEGRHDVNLLAHRFIARLTAAALRHRPFEPEFPDLHLLEDLPTDRKEIDDAVVCELNSLIAGQKWEPAGENMVFNSKDGKDPLYLGVEVDEVRGDVTVWFGSSSHLIRAKRRRRRILGLPIGPRENTHKPYDDALNAFRFIRNQVLERETRYYADKAAEMINKRREAAAMEALERDILARLGIADPYAQAAGAA